MLRRLHVGWKLAVLAGAAIAAVLLLGVGSEGQTQAPPPNKSLPAAGAGTATGTLDKKMPHRLRIRPHEITLVYLSGTGLTGTDTSQLSAQLTLGAYSIKVVDSEVINDTIIAVWLKPTGARIEVKKSDPKDSDDLIITLTNGGGTATPSPPIPVVVGS